MNDPENASNEGLSYKKDHYLNFEEFWPYYLSQHRDVRCRMTHFGGVSAAATLVVLGLFFAQPFWILLAVLAHLRFDRPSDINSSSVGKR